MLYSLGRKTQPSEATKLKPTMTTRCLCGSNKNYDTCCGQYHQGKLAPTPESLMRSRYSAFVKGDLTYIEKTSAGEARLAFNRRSREHALGQTEWLGLQILDVQRGGENDAAGFVTFKIRFKENGQLFTQTERSEFRRIGNEWRYWNGEFDISDMSAKETKIGRNELCNCGSGKKFKKCCGASPNRSSMINALEPGDGS